jgi:hypothetical protein
MALASKLYTWPNVVETPLPGTVCFCELGTALGAELALLDKIIYTSSTQACGHDG